MPNTIIIHGTIDSDVSVRNDIGERKSTVAAFRINDGKGWFNVDCWDDLAKRVPAKGTYVIVQGRLTNRSYEKDGQKHIITTIVASTLDAVGAGTPAAVPSPAAAPSTGPAPASPAPSPLRQPTAAELDPLFQD